MKEMGINDLKFGDFAENITTEGIILYELPVGTRLAIGETLHEVTQIGKECHTGCAIAQKVGKCVMPKEGIFTKVLKGGIINEGDLIEIL
jgi:cyclic pyranopterin phosphate synthase